MNYTIKGKVIKGDGYGKKIGFPTINLDGRNFLRMKEKPDFGVYAGRATIMSNTRCLTYRAGIVIGPLDKKSSPRHRRGKPKIEAHLIGFKGNAYGKNAVLEVNKFIRKFKKFKNKEELIKQIGKDLEKC